MKERTFHTALKGTWLVVIVSAALILAAAVLYFAGGTAHALAALESSPVAYAAPQSPIPPPQGYPKLSLSAKLVAPDLAHTGGESLVYRLELRNTGAWAAEGVSLVDLFPPHTTYNGDALSSMPPAPQVASGALTWTGGVGFDSVVVISYSLTVDPAFSGTLTNTAVINHPLIPEPVLVSARALVTDDPLLVIRKTATPAKPGPGKPLSYALLVTNIGQPAVDLPVLVTDQVPEDTAVSQVGPDGQVSPNGRQVIWDRPVSLATGASSVFTFSVDIASVPSGTVITNDAYQVGSAVTGVAAGEPHTITVVDPQFFISKSTWPDPPGSNRELTYTLTVVNRGSLATDLEVIDHLPVGVTYLRGGNVQAGEVHWTLPALDTGESAVFSYTGFVGDVAEVFILNDDYSVCSAEGVCQAGEPLSSLVKGPQFSAELWLDPVAKKPGGGTGPVTPTLVLRNLGPGSALDAQAQLIFGRISVSFNDLLQYPPVGQFYEGSDCGEKCVSYYWRGDLAIGEVVTITTIEGQNSVGGAEGTHYTATVVMTDELGTYTTQPYSATAIGHVTHFANLIPTKTAPAVIGSGQEMTYTIQVYNSGLSTDEPPYPVLTETLPASVTLLRVSDGGEVQNSGAGTTISWTLPEMSPGDKIFRSFAVQVDPDLVSGTLLINDQYRTSWFDIEASGTLSNTGAPVTTTVREVGLIDSYKTVTPELAHPGVGTLLTYTVYMVNSSPAALQDVTVEDVFPWEHSTYQRDAVASSGSLISDIVSLSWIGDLAPNSQELITLTVLVDPDFSGVLTNTATIAHPSLNQPISVTAVAYITDQPVLRLTKTAAPDPVEMGAELVYNLRLQNLGQQATGVVLTDTLPVNVAYVAGSATAGGQLVGDTLRWGFALLKPGETRSFTFKVRVLGGMFVINEKYRVSCAEGVWATGAPVITKVSQHYSFMPAVYRGP